MSCPSPSGTWACRPKTACPSHEAGTQALATCRARKIILIRRARAIVGPTWTCGGMLVGQKWAEGQGRGRCCYRRGGGETGWRVLPTKLPRYPMLTSLSMPGPAHGANGTDFGDFQYGREAISRITQAREEPFFLYLAFQSMHAPVQAPQKVGV